MLPLKISMATLFKQTFANEMVMWFSTEKPGLKTICQQKLNTCPINHPCFTVPRLSFSFLLSI